APLFFASRLSRASRSLGERAVFDLLCAPIVLFLRNLAFLQVFVELVELLLVRMLICRRAGRAGGERYVARLARAAGGAHERHDGKGRQRLLRTHGLSPLWLVSRLRLRTV